MQAKRAPGAVGEIHRHSHVRLFARVPAIVVLSDDVVLIDPVISSSEETAFCVAARVPSA